MTEPHNTTAGLGRIGHLASALTLTAFSRQVKESLDLGLVKVAGNPELELRRAVVCGGSGRTLIGDFLASDAQVFVSGDLGYHDGRRVEAEGRALIDVGHFASEQLIVDGLVAQLNHTLSEMGHRVSIRACQEQKDCFYYL
jgi:putative NIF3 family GTP cyclohydrolase 1 type 2